MGFHKNQVKDFVKRAKERVGGDAGWSFVGPCIRRMALRSEAFCIFAGQDESARFGSEDLHALIRAMHEVAGTSEEGDF
jgi:hypothetical protein